MSDKINILLKNYPYVTLLYAIFINILYYKLNRSLFKNTKDYYIFSRSSKEAKPTKPTIDILAIIFTAFLLESIVEIFYPHSFHSDLIIFAHAMLFFFYIPFLLYQKYKSKN